MALILEYFSYSLNHWIPYQGTEQVLFQRVLILFFSLSATLPISLSLRCLLLPIPYCYIPRSAQVGFTPENVVKVSFSSFQAISSPKQNVALACPPLLLRRSQPKCSFAAIRLQAPFLGGLVPETLRSAVSRFHYLMTFARQRSSPGQSGDVYKDPP